MKKYLITFLFLLILYPSSVKAADYSYNVCNKCTYKTLDKAIEEINNNTYNEMDNITIKLSEEEYSIDNNINIDKNINFNIIGIDIEKTRIKVNNNINFSNLNNINIKNISFIGSSNETNFYFKNINNLNIRGVNYLGFNNSDNLMIVESTNTSLDKVSIKESNCLYGLEIHNKNNENINITNSDFSGVSNGVYIIGSSNSNAQVNIDNTTLNNEEFSIISNITSSGEKINNNNYKYRIAKLGYIDSLVDTSLANYINVTNSKITGVKASSGNSTDRNIIYIDSSNMWFKDIKIEKDDFSYIYYDNLIKKIATMEVNGEKTLNDIFGIKFDDNTLWDITDNEILKIEDGKIIGLKTGISKIKARNNLDVYDLEVTVINNPKTVSTVYITIVIVLLVSFGTGIILTIKDNKDKNSKEGKKEEEKEEIEIL